MEQVKKGNKKGLIIALGVLALIVAALLVVSVLTKGKAQQGAKTVTIEIAKSETDVTEKVLHTDAETLEQAMTEAALIGGHVEEYGYFVETVDGRTADSEKGEWWMFTKDGEWVTTGVSETLIADGDHYEFFIYVG